MSEGYADLTDRMREVFAQVVDTYLGSGQPVGSKAIAPRISLSSASIRGVMSQLEERGLLTHPHTSAGRLPTEQGLRLFVDGIMQAKLPQRARAAIEADVETGSIDEAIEKATATLSGLSSCAGVVSVPTREFTLKQFALVPLDEARALAVLVGADGAVENRMVSLPAGTSQIALQEISNYVTARLAGLTLGEAEARLRSDIAEARAEVDRKAATLIAQGLASWARDAEERPVLIVKGAANLLDEDAAADLERVRQLLGQLEDRQQIASLLDRTHEAEGVRVFIGSENRMFSLSGSSVIAAPYRGPDGGVVGVVGVIGPTRLNYARVVPMVDFTAEALTRRMS